MKRLLILGMVALVAWSCDRDNDDGSYVISKFVMGYYTYDDITIEVNKDNDILVHPQIDEIIYEGTADSSVRARFDALAAKYNDTGYSKRKSYLPIEYLENQMPVENIQSIELVCLEEFDAQHPAESLVNDCVTFTAYSPLPFLLSNYQRTNGYDSNLSFKYLSSMYSIFTYSIISKPLSEITADDMVLIGDGQTYKPMIFYLSPTAGSLDSFMGKRFCLTLNYENQAPITTEFTFSPSKI